MLGNWIIIVAICLAVGFILACYTIPQWLTQSYTFATAKERADAVDAYRKTLAQVLGGFALVVTFSWTVLKDSQTLDQGKLQLANQQFIDGAKLLKESNAGASTAGVHALGQVAIARTEFEPLVTGTLVSFIKSGKPQTVQNNDNTFPNGSPATIPANVQAAIAVLASRPQNDGSQIDLYGAYLVRAKFSVADRHRTSAFRGAKFQAAILHGADFGNLDLSNAKFGGSHMADWEAYATWTDATATDPNYSDKVRHLFTVNFENAKLAQVNFDNALMGGANLKGANLKDASLWQTNLSRADLTKAINLPRFEGVILTDAIFAYTDLAGVEFVKARLDGTNFKGAKNVNRAIFRDACSARDPLFDPGVGKKFPSCPE